MNPITITAGTAAKASSLANVANTAAMVGTNMQGIPGTIDSFINLFGGKKRREKLFKEQLSQQDRLHALAYGYNEMSAEEAYRRQREMYFTEFANNTPLKQRQRLEAAGFNPALMFGDMGGVGGANFPSSSQGGGASGSAQATTPGEIEMARAANRQANAQLALTQSQAKLNNAQADKIKGVDTEYTGALIELTKEEQLNRSAQSRAIEVQTEINEIKKRITEATEAYEIGQIKEDFLFTIRQIQKLEQDIESGKEDLDIKRKTKNTVIQTAAAELASINKEILLKQSQIDLNEQQVEKITNDIIFIWAELILKSSVEVRGQGRNTIWGAASNIFDKLSGRDIDNTNQLVDIVQSIRNYLEKTEPKDWKKHGEFFDIKNWRP